MTRGHGAKLWNVSDTVEFDFLGVSATVEFNSVVLTTESPPLAKSFNNPTGACPRGAAGKKHASISTLVSVSV
jgi:hypothetical protein